MKIDKKLIKELVDYLDEFNITEIEYQDGGKKIKVSKISRIKVELAKPVQLCQVIKCFN